VEDQPVPDVSSTAPTDVRLWVALDVHKLSIVAAVLPPMGGTPEVSRIETTPAAIRRFIARLGGPEGLAVCYEAGPGGYALWRMLTRLGVACDIVAPSLVPVRAGDRVKTDRRDAKKLVRLYRSGELVFVQPPTPETEGLRDLMRCREDLRRARTAARHRVAKPLLRHGRVYRERGDLVDENASRLGRPAAARRQPGATGARPDAAPSRRDRPPTRPARP
jgi:transposase